MWEPEDGKFEYAWMDSVVEKLHAAGIRVILGTITRYGFDDLGTMSLMKRQYRVLATTHLLNVLLERLTAGGIVVLA